MRPIRYFFLLFCALLVTDANAQTLALLDSMTRAIQKQEYTGIHSVLISKGGKLVYEHYFNGYTADSLHDSRSSFKSVTSLLLGIAVDKGIYKKC